MSDAPRYQTLRDYLRVIRAQRWVIAFFAAAFAIAALLLSIQQDATYRAEAALAFKEPTQDLDLLGVGGLSRQSAEQRAAVNAELVTRPAVAERVKEALGTEMPARVLADSVSARPEARTNLVIVEARAGSAESAAVIANEFAKQAAAVARDDERRRLRSAERSLRESYERAQRERASDFTRSLFIDRLSRLQALQDFGRPAEVTRLAEAPSGPVSPKPIRNTVLGAILGLALGLLAAFGRDSLDVRLRSARDVQANVKLPLIGFVGTEAMGSAGVASRNGTRARVGPAHLESFRILRKNLEFLDIDAPLRTLAVTSALPEEGKSTVAASLAAAYAQGGKRTLLVECDLRRPSLAGRLGIERQPGLSDYLTERAGPQEVLQGVDLSDGDDRSPDTEELVCITAGSPVPRPGDILGSQRFRGFLAEVSEAYDVVILDTSPLLSVSDTLELLPHVDGIVLCVRAGRTSRDEARAAKAALDHLPPKPTGLCVTGISRGDEIDYGYYSSAYDYAVKS